MIHLKGRDCYKVNMTCLHLNNMDASEISRGARYGVPPNRLLSFMSDISLHYA